MRNTIRSLAVLLALQPVLAAAQQFPSLPANTVIGRLGIGPGPSQAIPVGAFAAAAGFAKGPQSCSSHNWFNTLSAIGVLGCGQPSFADLTGNIAVAQMNSGTGASASTMWAGDGTWKQPQAMPYTPTNASPSAQTIQAQLKKIPVSCEDYNGGCTAANISQAMSDAATNGQCFQFNGNYTIAASVALVAPAGVLCLTGRGGLVGSGSMNGALLDIKNSNNGVYIGSGLAFSCSGILSIPAAIKIWTDGAGGTQNNSINGPIIVGCRRGVQFGDPAFTDFIVDGNYIQGGGYTFNVAQPVAMYSSQGGLFVDNFLNHADNSNLSSTLTGTCSGTTLTAASVTGYLAKDDVLTGTGVTTAGTYITAQITGPSGGAGTYTVSSSCTSSSASLTARPAAINYLVVGGALNVRNGNVENTVIGGKLFVARPVNSATFGFPYGRPSVVGSTIEGADIIFSSDPDGVGAPGSGAFYMTGVQGDFSQNINCYITTDTAWTGNIGVSNNRLFSTAARTANNICMNNSGAKAYFDLQSFGSNMKQGLAGVSGGKQFMVASTGATSAGTPSSPTGTTSSTGVMMGLGTTCGITPQATGRVQISFVGSSQNTTVNINTMNIRFGTGTAPANGAALTGTTILGNDIKNSITLANNPFSFNVGSIATGLTPGTPYWFDMSLAASGGTGSLVQLNCSEIEF